MYQNENSIGIVILIQAKLGFHYHMRLGAHGIFILIQPPTPLYQIENSQELFYLVQTNSLGLNFFNILNMGNDPVQLITEASRPT